MTEINKMSDIKNKIVTVKDFEDTLLFQSPIPISWAVQKYSSLITTIESQKEEIEKWREFGKVTVQWYKDNDWPMKAIDVQAIVDWISYTPTLSAIEKQAEHWQEGDK